MGDSFSEHVDALLGDAVASAARGEWPRVRALTEAALALEPDRGEAQALLRRAEAATTQPGERRQLTVMFTDVVGSTAMSSTADPETVRDVLRAYQSVCTDVVTAHGGHVAQFVGDGVVIYFGHPQPHEDDPQRAVRAGLDLVAALPDVAASIRVHHGIDLAVRVAVHTGLVVRADMGSPEQPSRNEIVGPTPNIAARLQERATPGVLLVSAATNERVRDQFETVSIGPLELRGVPGAIEGFEVVGPRQLDARPATYAFVGRDEELGRLEAAWQAVAAGGSAFALLLGDAGIGKSRLARTFADRVVAGGFANLATACSAYHAETPLYPFRRLIESACGIGGRHDPADGVDVLRSALEGIGRSDLVGVFADLLNLPADGSWALPEIDGAQLRELTLAGIVDWLLAVGGGAPMLVVFDDVQWADPSTLDLLGRITSRRTPGLLVVAAARSGFSPRFARSPDTVVVDRLGAEDLRALAASVSGGEVAGDIDEMIRRCDGVPLYLEELVRAAGAEAVDSTSPRISGVPPALFDALLARLSSPNADLVLAQIMATIGHEVDAELLALVTGIPDPDLRRRLDGLIEAKVLEPLPGPAPAFRFRHHLMGEVAYETQLLPVRRRRHAAIADVLATIDLRGVPSDAGAVGYHLEKAGRISEAVTAYLASARAATVRGAFAEAGGQLAHALEIVAEVGPHDEQVSLEVAVRQARAMVAVSMSGYGDPIAGEDFERCFELCDELDRSTAHLPSLAAAFNHFLLGGDLERAERILVVDRRRFGIGPHDLIPIEAGRCVVRFFRGDLPGAISDFEAALGSPYALTMGDTPADWPFPDDPIVNLQSFYGLSRWIAGNTSGALDVFALAEARAQGLRFPHGPFALCFVKLVRVLAYRFVQDDDRAEDVLADLAPIAERHGFLFFTVVVALQRQMSMLRREGPELAADAISMSWQMLGLDAWLPWVLVEVAGAHVAAGDAPAALAWLDRVDEVAERTTVRFFSAEARRLRGEAKLLSGDTGGLDDLVAAADLARAQGIGIFEIRALTGAVRRNVDGARRRLTALVDVTDADGLADLDAARMVLAER
jgi:class 3 adenylate cyclase